MVTFRIPYEFLRKKTDLTWPDVRFGLEHQLITSNVAITEAANRVRPAAEPSEDEVELASRSPDEPVAELVFRLAKAHSGQPDDHIRSKWLYLVLAWLFENRGSVTDPLHLVEEIYSDFGYPREIAPFVRYMPMVGEDRGDPKRNEAQLYEYWERYLAQAAERFASTIHSA